METKEEINKEIRSLRLRVAGCDKVLKELSDTGQSWAFDCRAYRINEASKYSYLTQISKLEWKLKKVVR